MRCSAGVPDTKTCFQTNSLTHPLVGSLYKFRCAVVRAVAHPRRRLRRRSIQKLAACPPSLPSTPSGVQCPSCPDDDLPHQSHINLAQQHRPSLSPICNWLEGDDVRIVGGLPVSAGGFADLWRGSLDTRQVTIKSYRRYLSFDLSQVFLRFSREALVCSRLSHRNIVSFIGIYSTANHPFSLVFNFAGHLDLGQYLKTHPTAWRLELLADVARGLNHMHDLGIVHGNLKIDNILVDLDGTARIAGLGSALILGHTTVWSEMSGEWSFRGSAPELMYPEEFGLSHPQNSKASDVYAFSVLAWEVFTGHPVFPDNFNAIATHAMWRGAQPSRPDHPEVSNRVWEMMKKCRKRVPSERATITEVVRILEMEHTTKFHGAP